MTTSDCHHIVPCPHNRGLPPPVPCLLFLFIHAPFRIVLQTSTRQNICLVPSHIAGKRVTVLSGPMLWLTSGKKKKSS